MNVYVCEKGILRDYGSKNISDLLKEIFIANTTMLKRTTSERYYYGGLAVDRPVRRDWQLYVIWKWNYDMKY